MEGVTICPGDYIFGDADGVVIIPKDIVDEVLEKSFQTVKKEDQVRDGLLQGIDIRKVYAEIGAI